MAGAYKRIRLHQYAKTSNETAETRHWGTFQTLADKHDFSVNHVAFSPHNPTLLNAAVSTRVLVYDSRSCKVKSQYSKFKHKTLCCNFRADGALMAAGSQNNLLQVYETSKRQVLRTFRKHQGAVCIYVYISMFLQYTIHI